MYLGHKFTTPLNVTAGIAPYVTTASAVHSSSTLQYTPSGMQLNMPLFSPESAHPVSVASSWLAQLSTAWSSLIQAINAQYSTVDFSLAQSNAV